MLVSKHHYAIHLAKKGNEVFFLNPPSERYNKYNSRCKNLIIVDYTGFIKGIRYLIKPIRKLFTRRVYNKIESFVGRSFDIIWSFDNSVFFDFDAISDNVLKISHIVDLNMNFELARAARSASFCFCTTDLIQEKLTRHTDNIEKVFKINHGLAIPDRISSNLNIPGENLIKAAYAGNLAMQYLDWKIIYEVVSVNTEIDFVFYGSNHNVFDEKINSSHNYKRLVFEEPNTFFPGILKGEDLIPVLCQADVLMICYKEAHHQDQANPHKILEYLYTGKSIVATATKEYENSELICMSTHNNEWPSLFNKVIKNLNKWNSDYMEDKRRKFALNNTYELQIQRIQKIIQTDSISQLHS